MSRRGAGRTRVLSHVAIVAIGLVVVTGVFIGASMGRASNASALSSRATTAVAGGGPIPNSVTPPPGGGGCTGECILFTCPHGSIVLVSTTECSDQTNNLVVFPAGTYSGTLTAKVNSGYDFAGLSSVANVCLGSSSKCAGYVSYVNPTTLYYTCSGNCTGSVTLSTYVAATAVLAGNYSDYPNGSSWSYTFTLTVPTGATEEFFFWAITDSTVPSHTFPSCLTVEENPSNYDLGLAYGSCSAGSQSVKFGSNGGWVNTVTMAEYLSYESSPKYAPGVVFPGTSLTMYANYTTYLGLLYTGGAWPLTHPSLTTVNVWVRSQNLGETDLIGQQSSNVLSFTTSASSYGIVALALK